LLVDSNNKNRIWLDVSDWKAVEIFGVNWMCVWNADKDEPVVAFESRQFLVSETGKANFSGMKSEF